MTDVAGNIERYLADRNATARYSSFDYCYNYFQSFRELNKVGDLAGKPQLQESCLQLAFYLASWGMLRGSSDLLRRSVKYYVPLIEAVVESPEPIWDIDVATYSDESMEVLFATRSRIRAAFDRPVSDTLVTKILLGVFGCVPAFDLYFRKGMGVTTFGRRSLVKIRNFYDQHAEVIEGHRVQTIDFGSGQRTHRKYPQAKIIDMVFFIEGGWGPSTSQPTVADPPRSG